MLPIIKRLLGLDSEAHTHSESREDVPRVQSKVPEIAPLERGSSLESRSSEDYFSTMGRLREAIAKRDYTLAADLTRQNLKGLPALGKTMVKESGQFYIQSIPALEEGGTMLALAGDHSALVEMKSIVESIPGLGKWNGTAERHMEDLHTFQAIVDVVRENPGSLQTSIKGLVGADDGRRVSTLISWLEKAGRIARERKGSTYVLSIPDSSKPPVPQKQVASHRKGRDVAPVRDLNLSSVQYVSLPRAPLRWEERQARGIGKADADANESFEIRDADWSLRSIEKIPMPERPDTAYRRLHPHNNGVMMLDDLGRASAFPKAPASALNFGRNGSQLNARPLLHDTYRTAGNPLGNGLIAMSKACIAHAYGIELNPILETSVRDAPETSALIKRLGIQMDALKNHIRCVALSFDNSRYLLTGVDEAWCFTLDGEALWSVRLPLQEGWREIAESAGPIGTSQEIHEALKLMDLSLPLTTDELKRRYRELAKQWHPDLNQGDPSSTERMKALTNAAEILTGVDAAALPHYTGRVFEKQSDRQEIDVGGQRMSLSFAWMGGEIDAADWIYAAAFAGRSQEVFIAGYSGRIVHLNAEGKPKRVYDIGAVPRRIVDTGDYLYFLTDTRLYVLREDALHAVVDTFDGGELLMAQTGFGLLESKRFRWFREDGEYLGAVLTHEPIRRVYYGTDGLTVETRQRRAVIGGAPEWWD